MLSAGNTHFPLVTTTKKILNSSPCNTCSRSSDASPHSIACAHAFCAKAHIASLMCRHCSAVRCHNPCRCWWMCCVTRARPANESQPAVQKLKHAEHSNCVALETLTHCSGVSQYLRVASFCCTNMLVTHTVWL